MFYIDKRRGTKKICKYENNEQNNAFTQKEHILISQILFDL